MKKRILGILLILGWVGAVQASELEYVRVKPGDTLSALFREETARACELNLELGRIKSKNCNQIRPGEELQRPVKLSAKQAKAARPQQSEPACITIGAAPFNPEHNPERMLQGIDLLTELTPEQKELAKQKFARGEMATENELVGQQVFKEMLYQSTRAKKEVKHVYGKPICSSEQGGRPEVMNTYDLGGGVFLSDPRRCGNPSVFTKPVPIASVPPAPPAPPASAPVPDVPASAPPAGVVAEPEPQEIPPEEAVRRWDWEMVVGRQYDRTAQSIFGSGAFYGFFLDGNGTEHAFGLGATYSGWHGKTDTGFRFDGTLKTDKPGFAYKLSAYEGGWDFGLKLLPWMSLEENGGQAAFNSHRDFEGRGITLAYNNYARDLKGEKSFFKHQLFLSVFKPTGGEATQTAFNQPFGTADARLDHVVNVGGRLGLYNFSEENEDGTICSKAWFSLGYFEEAPDLAKTANWRFECSDKHERFFFGLGRNYDVLHGGSLLGYGWSWDVRKTVYVHREETRRAQFVAAVEKAGGKLDKDGMVILPKGMKSSQKQFKAAPSDD